MANHVKAITTITKIYEKDIVSPNIAIGREINREEMRDIENLHQKSVQEAYDKGDIYMNEYEHKDTYFKTRLDINDEDRNVDEYKFSTCLDIEGVMPEVKTECVSFEITKTERYGVSFDIAYLTEEERDKKVDELMNHLHDRYIDCDGDIEELDYIDGSCEMDVDEVSNEYYSGGEDHVNDFEEEFGNDSVLKRRKEIDCFILDRNTSNYIQTILMHKEMHSYSEYIVETKNHIILLGSKGDYEYLLDHMKEIIKIEECGNFNRFLIIFKQFY